MAVKVITCVICSKNENVKYRCPRCKQTYCSVSCCKEHKLKCCPEASAENAVEKVTPTSPAHRHRPQYNYETEDTVPVEKLELLRGSEKLKEILGNPHLRRMMAAIDASDDAADLIGEAMKEPIFTELADEVLKVIGDDADEEVDSDMDEL